MKFLLYISALAATTVHANTSGPNLRDYKVIQITPTLAGCNATRAAVEARFVAITGLKTLGSNCVENPGHSADLSLEYVVSEKDPTFVSTFRDSPLAHGLYLSKESCNAALPKQVSDFEANTGLKSLVAFCFKDYRQWNEDTSWTLRIDSFGTAKLQPFAIPEHRFGNLSAADLSAQQLALTAHLSALNAVSPNVAIWSNGSSTFIMMLYYAKAKLPLTTYELGLAKTEADCRALQPRIQDIVAKATGTIGVYMCLKTQFGHGVEIFVLASTMGPLANMLSELPYNTIAECDKERPAIEQKWHDVLNRNVVGSLCTMENLTGDYKVQMRLFWLE